MKSPRERMIELVSEALREDENPNEIGMIVLTLYEAADNEENDYTVRFSTISDPDYRQRCEKFMTDILDHIAEKKGRVQ